VATRTAQNTAWAAALAASMAVAIWLQVERDRRYPESQINDRFLYLSSGDVMAKAGLSYDALLADVYWIRAIQHYGSDRLAPNVSKRYDLLYPLLDLTTSLDPRFTVAYRFGAIFLAEPYPGGAGRPDLAVALLEKAVRATPDKWEYYHDIGFAYYWHLHDYRKAAEWFLRGADQPGGPWWLRTYAAVMLTRGGDRQASRFMWRNIYETTDNDWLRQNAGTRLLQLDALDQIEQLQALVRQFEGRAGRRPGSWDEMVAARLLERVPADPAGAPYVLDRQTGIVSLSGSSKLHPLPVEPNATSSSPGAPTS
jgi:tetratricopeptide (TPR) repeat protein